MDRRSIGLGRLLGGLVDADLREERRAAAGDDAAPQGGVEDGGQESGGDSHPHGRDGRGDRELDGGVVADAETGDVAAVEADLIHRLRTVPRGGRLIYNLMSNAKTGLWSAVGALLGGVAGAFAGKAAVQYMPRKYYGARRGVDVADAMATGAAAGAVVGAFAAGTMAGEAHALPAQLPPK